MAVKGDFDYTFEPDDPDVRAVNEDRYDPPVSRNAATGEIELNVSDPEIYDVPRAARATGGNGTLWFVGIGVALFLAWKML